MIDLDREDDDLRLDDDAQALIDQAEESHDVGEAAEAIVARDEAGRFAARREAPADAAPAAPPAAEDPAKPATLQELKTFLDEAERRRAAERERDDLRQRLAQHEKPAQAKPIDPALMFEDPNAYRDAILAPVQQELHSTRLQMAELRAQITHGPALAEAQQALAATGNEQLAASFLRQPNPFDALVSWHRREKTLAAIPDGDLTKYEASLQERLLKDPAFLERAMAARGEAGQQPGVAPRQSASVHRLPSAARAGTAAAIAAIPDDVSDQDLLESITARR
jgi:hypothetical protein